MSSLDRERARHLLGRFSGVRLLVIGDLMVDHYQMGEVHRISPEAPVPIVRVRSESFRLGGAGNVAANARALGASVALVGVLGADPAAECFRAELVAHAIDGTGLVTDDSRPTTVKTRVIAHSQQVVRCDREDDRPVATAIEDRVLEALLRHLPTADAILVSDYAKGLLTERLLKEVLAAAQARARPVVVDPAIASFGSYRGVTALTPNHHEAAAAAQLRGHEDAAVQALAQRILEMLEPQAILITRGESGMTLLERTGQLSHIPAAAREVYDVSGAGDTVITVFTLALAAGASFVEAAMLSNQAAGVVVGKLGTATATAGEILSTL